MKIKVSQILGPLVAVSLFVAAVLFLRNELKELSLEGVMREFSNLPRRDLYWAFGLTVLSYLVLTCYDYLALKYVKHPLSYPKVAAASFVGYTLSHNLGFPLITGGSARYRMLTAWGLSGMEIARAILFSGALFWLGFSALAGVVLVLEPPMLPEGAVQSWVSLRPLGAICLGIVFLYFYLVHGQGRSFKARNLELEPPPLLLSIGGITLASIDWAISAGVAWAILPLPQLSFLQFLGIFALAQFGGLMSHVPGGIGVFEAIILLFGASQQVPEASLIGALLAYRVIYYILPLVLSMSFMLLHESIIYKRIVLIFTNRVLRRVSVYVPLLMSWALFIAGSLLLFSSAMPTLKERVVWLAQFLPLPLVELSHLLSSLTGLALLVLARGIQLRLGLAYVLAQVLLAAGILTSLFKGGDYEEAIVLGLIMALLSRSRRRFHRKASLMQQGFSPAWIAAIAAVLVAVPGLLYFAYGHVAYSSHLWWEFSFLSSAPRSMRATLLVLVIAACWGGMRLLSPARGHTEIPEDSELELAADIVKRAPGSQAALALLGDKALMFNRSCTAFLMYAIHHRSWIALGDPVGPAEEMPRLIARFREACDKYAGDCLFFQVRQENLSLYLDAGFSLLKLGEEALVSLPDFTLEDSARGALRANREAWQRAGYSISIHSVEETAALLPQLQPISDSWLIERGTAEQSFLMGGFQPEYLKLFPLALLKQGERILGFASLHQSAGNREVAVDLLRYMPGLPADVMDYMLVELMLWARAAGFEHFNLGLAPLPGHEGDELAGFWERLGRLFSLQTEAFSDAAGMRYYKEKFSPRWEARYLAAPSGVKMRRVAADLASLISGGFARILLK